MMSDRDYQALVEALFHTVDTKVEVIGNGDVLKIHYPYEKDLCVAKENGDVLVMSFSYGSRVYQIHYEKGNMMLLDFSDKDADEEGYQLELNEIACLIDCIKSESNVAKTNTGVKLLIDNLNKQAGEVCASISQKSEHSHDDFLKICEIGKELIRLKTKLEKLERVEYGVVSPDGDLARSTCFADPDATISAATVHFGEDWTDLLEKGYEIVELCDGEYKP